MNTLELNGRIAFVTGAAAGIGLGTARALHARGATVVMTDLDEQATRRAASSVGDERVLALAADVTDRDALGSAVSIAVECFGGLDVVVANAGIGGRLATVRAMREEDFDAVIAVNLRGVWNTVRATLPLVIERRGHVTIVSSIYAFSNPMLMAPYAIAKAGVEQLGRALRHELAPHGASAGVAYFGFIDTALVGDLLADPVGIRLKALLPRPLLKKLPPAAAGDVIAGAVERRAAKVIAPRRWAVSRALRGVSDPVEARYLARRPDLLPLLAAADSVNLDASVSCGA